MLNVCIWTTRAMLFMNKQVKAICFFLFSSSWFNLFGWSSKHYPRDRKSPFYWLRSYSDYRKYICICGITWWYQPSGYIVNSLSQSILHIKHTQREKHTEKKYDFVCEFSFLSAHNKESILTSTDSMWTIYLFLFSREFFEFGFSNTQMCEYVRKECEEKKPIKITLLYPWIMNVILEAISIEIQEATMQFMNHLRKTLVSLISKNPLHHTHKFEHGVSCWEKRRDTVIDRIRPFRLYQF